MASADTFSLAPGAVLNDVVVKSPNDKRDYRVIVLPNGLRALLISDVEPSAAPADSAAAAGKLGGARGAAAAAIRPSSYRRQHHVHTGSPGHSSPSSDVDNSDMSVESFEDDADSLCESDSSSVGSGHYHDLGHHQDNSHHRDNIMAITHAKKAGVPVHNSAIGFPSDDSSDGEKLAAAALCLGVGSFSDPDDLPGLAHFVEHMVFMGSEKYPDENAFDSFIKKHGGSGNAYTECERTVFYFDVERRHFQQALDIFAQFFISPLMKKDSVDREIKAVDNEFDMSKPSDSARKQQLLGSLAKPGHPMAKFMWGNEYTLKTQPVERGVDIYDRCREFHDRHYSSHYMTLAVQVREKLDTIEEWVRKIFSAMPNTKLPQPTFGHLVDGFATPQFHKLYKVIPVKNIHQLELSWSLPCMQKHYRRKPLHYIGWLTGHEGAGSILSYLKKKLWALAVSSGNGESGYEQNATGCSFVVVVTLTDHGLSKVYEIMTVIFEYLAMLRAVGPQLRIYDEIKTIEDNEFRWKEQVDPSEYVEHLAEAMHLYAPEDYLTGDSLMFEYEPEVITQSLQLLTPERCNAMVLSKCFDNSDGHGFLEEPWYRTRYTVSDFDSNWLSKWKRLDPRPELHLPEPNRYIATDFFVRSLLPCSADHPVLLVKNQQMRMWHKQDSKFRVPRGFIYLHLMSPVVCATARSQATFDLFVELLIHSLQEVAYAAHVAQLEYEFKVQQTGLSIKLSGFNDKLSQLFKTIVDHIVDFTVSDEMFHVVNEQQKKKYYNSFIKPEKLARDLRLHLTQNSMWAQPERRTMLITLQKEDLLAFVADFLRMLFIEGYVHGNFLAEDAIEIAHYIGGKLNESILASTMLPEERVVKLPDGMRYCRVTSFNANDVNSVVCNYYQMGPCNIHNFVLTELLTAVMDEPCFDILRTREQLGYAVYCSIKNTYGIVGLVISVSTQASKFSVRYVDEKIEMFLAEFDERLATLKQEDFQHQVSSLIAIKQCDDSHMGEEADRHWVEILDRTYMFDRLDCEIEEAEKLTLDELRLWFRTTMFGRDRKKLSVQVVGMGETEQGHRSPKRHPPYEVNASKRSRPSSPAPAVPRSPTTSLERSSFSTTANASADAKKAYEYEYLQEAQPDGRQDPASISDPVAFKNSLPLYPVSKVLKELPPAVHGTK